jgi:hypothetical protein
VDEQERLLHAVRPWFPGALRVYPYRDKQGRPRYLHIRVDAGDHPSKFRRATVDDDGSISPGKAASTTQVEPLYRYGQAKRRLDDLGPDVLWVVEGERDADTLWDKGYIAVCQPDGASKPGQQVKWKDLYTQAIRALNASAIHVVADNDKPGYWTAGNIADLLGAADGCPPAART